ncbi:MAG: hypothetical protein KKF46_00125 [Nanoarchaeota archaeon]|nr:hypothetical protein [Nanoarchaeota archaeon]MBU1320740.1 hypothetical protein [Nanoarchaeota archaeon]MBU1596893.1 hypothetical protein [Nanoarchaeota archaeon]MBU2440827.1 hypothetical protein [Nanoarchaeota archaeon]
MVEKRGEDASSNKINKLILKRAAHKRTDQILKKAFISEKEVYELIRSFFKKYLEVDYEFTHQEMLSELKRVYLTPELQKKVDGLFKKISAVEHDSASLERKELEKLLVDFKQIVEELIVTHYQQDSSFLKKLKDSIHKLFSREHTKLLELDNSVLSENERTIVKMNMLLDNSKRWANTDISKAKKAYKELISLYDSLDDGKKKVFFGPVNELYQIIQNKGV